MKRLLQNLLPLWQMYMGFEQHRTGEQPIVIYMHRTFQCYVHREYAYTLSTLTTGISLCPLAAK